jgi:uncharacterized protein
LAGKPPSTSPPARILIDGYGPGRLRVGGALYERPILVLPEGVRDWPVASFASLSRASLAAVLAATPPVEILIVGCGARVILVPPALRQELREAGLKLDAMDTGAACRTYNLLLAEDRRVAAALIPLPAAPG